jgi:hypothetical protein
MGGKLITDPTRLSALHAIHQDVLRLSKTEDAITVDRSSASSSTNLTLTAAHHDKRVYQVFGLLGLRLISELGLKALENVIDALLDLFTSDDIIWTSKENCRAYFSTQGGGNENLRTYAKGKGSATAEDKIK